MLTDLWRAAAWPVRPNSGVVKWSNQSVLLTNLDATFHLNAYMAPPTHEKGPWNFSTWVFWGTHGYLEQAPIELYDKSNGEANPAVGALDWSACIGVTMNSPCPDKCAVCPAPAFGGNGYTTQGNFTVPMSNWVPRYGHMPYSWSVAEWTFPAGKQAYWVPFMEDAAEAWNDAMGFQILETSAAPGLPIPNFLVVGTTKDSLSSLVPELGEDLPEPFDDWTQSMLEWLRDFLTLRAFAITLPLFKMEPTPHTECPADKVVSYDRALILVMHDQTDDWSGCELELNASGTGPPFDNVPGSSLMTHEVGHALGTDHCEDCSGALMASSLAYGVCYNHRNIRIDVRDAIVCASERGRPR